MPSDDSVLNPYAPPSTLDLVPPTPEDSEDLALFFHVGAWKLILMSLTTFGLYLAYWHYRHWKVVKVRTGENLWPIPRALFYPLTGFDLYSRIEDAALRAEVPLSWKAWMVGVAVLVLNALSYLHELLGVPFLQHSIYLQALPIALVQVGVNETLDKVASTGRRNNRLSGWNISWLILFALLMGLAWLGSRAPR